MNSLDRLFASFAEGGPLPLMVCQVLDFPVGSFTLDGVRARVAARSARLEALRLVTEPKAGSRLRTAPPDIEVHVTGRRVDGRLAAATDEVLRLPLPAGSLPGWDLHVLSCPVEGVQRVCFRIDHALLDGVGTAHLVAALLSDDPAPGPRPYRPTAPGRASLDWVRTLPWRGLRPHETAPLGCGSGPECPPTLAYADLPDAVLREVAGERSVTVNDLYLAAVAGALRSWQQQRAGRVRDVVVMMPMSVREAAATLVPGNAAVGAVVRLPCTLGTARERLDAVAGQAGRLKASGLRDSGWWAFSRLPVGVLGRLHARAGLRMATSHIGLGDPYRVLGAPVRAAGIVALNTPGLLGYFSLTRTATTARISLLHDGTLPGAAELPALCARFLAP
ncbi:wax ester/triacylglycerol synthase domain-containing protein [Streptomyces virginiae]|uniref:wax ester/triacylglycerol synthase domain-containing protein n=1 Tax=Streptomyces virginiae TaxID=1961 RepID=UPI0037F1FB41